MTLTTYKFEEVLPAIREGKIAHRSNWKRVYLGFGKPKPDPSEYAAMFVYLFTDFDTPFLMLVLPNGAQTPYTITNQDLLAEDWLISDFEHSILGGES